MSTAAHRFRGETVTITAAGVQVLAGDRDEEDDPNGRPGVDRPIDLTDTPERNRSGSAPARGRLPGRVLPGDDNGTPAQDTTRVD
jgi:hypothetical protein